MHDPTTQRLRRTRYGLAWLLGLSVAAMGYITSFGNLKQYAEQHHFPVPAGLPIGLDLGIPALLLLDSLRPSRYLRWTAWALTAFTVWANGAVTPGDGLSDRALHAVMPAVAVLWCEAVRHLKDDPSRLDRIRWTRYLVAPVRTIRLRARMVLWEVTSYAEALTLESAILHARAVLVSEYGRRSWRRSAPVILRHQLATGQLPRELFYGDWQEAVEQWVRGVLDRLDPNRAPEPVKTAAVETVPEPVPAVVVERDPWDQVWDRLDRTVPDGLTPDQIVIAYGLARRHHEQHAKHIVADKLRRPIGPLGIGKPKALALAAAIKTAYETELDPRYQDRFPTPTAEDTEPATGETGPDHAAPPGPHTAPEPAPADA